MEVQEIKAIVFGYSKSLGLTPIHNIL